MGFMNRVLGALLVAGAVAGPAASADAVRQERIEFAPDTSEATVEGGIAGYDSVEYQVAAATGQTMTVALTADNASTYFNVYRPGDVPGQSTALHVGARDGNEWQATLRKTGDYTVQVFLIRAAARRAETSAFTLTVGVTGTPAATVEPAQKSAAPAAAAPAAGAPATEAPAAEATPAPDFADGLMGGPDYWQVAGLDAGELLNLRAEPSTTGAVLARYPEGTLLRNRGCRMTGTKRWCDVEPRDDSSVRGWVSGRYLREATGVAGDAAGG